MSDARPMGQTLSTGPARRSLWDVKLGTTYNRVAQPNTPPPPMLTRTDEMEDRVEARFLTLTDVSETLNVTLAQTKALVRSGDLSAIKIGGRGAWRVERSALEEYIERMYSQTREFIAREQTGGAEQRDQAHT